MAFVANGDFALTEIDLALETIPGVSGTNAVAVTLNSDGSGLPGAVLFSSTIVGVPAWNSCCQTQSVVPTSSIILASGTRYWVVASPGATDTRIAWMFNVESATGLNAVDTFGLGWQPENTTLAAFAALGDPSSVPEPSCVLLTIGGLFLGFNLRRGRIRSTSLWQEAGDLKGNVNVAIEPLLDTPLSQKDRVKLSSARQSAGIR